MDRFLSDVGQYFGSKKFYPIRKHLIFSLKQVLKGIFWALPVGLKSTKNLLPGRQAKSCSRKPHDEIVDLSKAFLFKLYCSVTESWTISILYRKHRRRNELIGHISILNECTGQFYLAAHCKVTRELKRLRNIDDLIPKQNVYHWSNPDVLVFNVQFHSNSFI